MTDPVNTDALREMGAALTSDGHAFGPRITAAADEVDRLQGALLDATVSYNTQISRGNGLARQVAELRAVIENAPHYTDSEGWWCQASNGEKCTCWKAGAL